jgi:hypothetical protein
MESVKLTEYITVEDLEQELLNIYKKNDGLINQLEIDLLEATHIRVEALVYLFAFLLKRFQNSQTTYLVYPQNWNARNFIKTFRLFEVIYESTGMRPIDYVKRLPENFSQTDYFEKNVLVSEKEKISYHEKKGYYPLTTLKFKTKDDKLFTLKEEPKKWTEGQPIISIIQKNLPKGVYVGDNISRNIVYESITNSIRHPRSDKLTVNCIKEDNQYIFTIWDNGEGILNTLKKELQSGNSIKDTTELDTDPHFCFCMEKEKGKSGKPKVENFNFFFSDEIPEINGVLDYKKEDWFILLASFFPGITRDPKGDDYKNGVLKGENDNKQENTIALGRGLSYLLNTAVNIFGGEVRVRTGNYFVNIKKAVKKYGSMPKMFKSKYPAYEVIEYNAINEIESTSKIEKVIQAVYRVKIEKKEYLPEFYGNMITVQIPQN